MWVNGSLRVARVAPGCPSDCWDWPQLQEESLFSPLLPPVLLHFFIASVLFYSALLSLIAEQKYRRSDAGLWHKVIIMWDTEDITFALVSPFFFFYFTGCQTAFFFFPLKPPQPYLLPSAENINPRSPKPYLAAERENFMKDERAVLPSYTFSVWQYLAVLTMKQHFLQGSHLHFKVCSSFSAECFSFRWK